jgi:hypothetical protein
MNLPLSDENPFNPGYGVEPPRFVGRDEVFHEILLGLRRGPGRDEFHWLVLGGRGTGKTVLLAHLRRHVEGEWAWPTIRWAGGSEWPLAQVLAEELPRVERELAGVIRRAGRALRPDVVEARTPVASARKSIGRGEPRGSATAQLRRLGELARDRNRTVVVVTDELQAVRSGDLATLSASMQIVANEERLPVAMLSAGLPSTRRVLRAIPGTTFIERQSDVVIGNLAPADTRDALETPIVEAGRQIEPAALDELVAATEGYPYAVQLAGKHAWNEAGAEPVITVGHARAGWRDAYAVLERNIYETRWERLAPAERRYVLAAVEVGGPRGSSTADIAARLGLTLQQLSPTRDALINEHHLLRAGDRGFVHVDIPGFAEWVRRTTGEHEPGR